jgi:hypothetical protein
LKSLRGEFHPHEKLVRVFVCVMVGVEDITAEVMDEAGDSRNDAFTVFAMNQQNDGVFPLGRH